MVRGEYSSHSMLILFYPLLILFKFSILNIVLHECFVLYSNVSIVMLLGSSVTQGCHSYCATQTQITFLFSASFHFTNIFSYWDFTKSPYLKLTSSLGKRGLLYYSRRLYKDRGVLETTSKFEIFWFISPSWPLSYLKPKPIYQHR